MAAILRDSTVVVVVVVVVAVVRTRPRAIPLSMINHEKIHTWVSFSYMVMGLRLAALRAAGAPLSRQIGRPGCNWFDTDLYQWESEPCYDQNDQNYLLA